MYYQSSPYSATNSYNDYSNSAQITLTAELLKRDTSDDCYGAKETVQVGNSLGKSSHTETVVIQKEHEAEKYTSEIHSQFIGGNYPKVIELAGTKIDWNPGSLDEANGIYYYIAASILDASEETGATDDYIYANVEPLLNRFFLRQTSTGVALVPYPNDVVDTAEFQKIRAYLCNIADKEGIKSIYESSEVGCPTVETS